LFKLVHIPKIDGGAIFLITIFVVGNNLLITQWHNSIY
jgi:hypothetical protein